MLVFSSLFKKKSDSGKILTSEQLFLKQNATLSGPPTHIWFKTNEKDQE